MTFIRLDANTKSSRRGTARRKPSWCTTVRRRNFQARPVASRSIEKRRTRISELSTEIDIKRRVPSVLYYRWREAEMRPISEKPKKVTGSPCVSSIRSAVLYDASENKRDNPPAPNFSGSCRTNFIPNRENKRWRKVISRRYIYLLRSYCTYTYRTMRDERRTSRSG